ncbi:hypothetical protein B0H21DRAFT_191881 [Amylocystis lapponica]|nr:hypothetical protein B0H21DRAFT_191881 [Amylocystis lapponica]
MSATPSTLRASLRRAASGRRHVSSASSSKKTAMLANPTLPPEKMRALVSLYHQTESFITPENLSQKIDEAFFDRPPLVRSPETSFQVLRDELRTRQAKPKVGEADMGKALPAVDYEMGERDGSWSEKRGEREMKVLQTLFGIEKSGTPALEVLEEEGWRMREHRRRDQERQS